MKVLLLNGSSHLHGCTDTALREIAAVLEAAGIEAEILFLGNEPVRDCTACGACVKACPKSIIELRAKGPRGMRLYVSCVNKDKGPVAKKACSAACIGCGICLKTCTKGAITLEGNLAYINYELCKLCRECEAVCPTGAIHGINFPKPLDKEAVKARIAERNRKAKEAAEAAIAENKEAQQ